MDLDQLIHDTFTAHEHLAPNEDEIMPAVHTRIGQRRRLVAARPLAIAASVVAVAGVASSAVVLSARHAGTDADQASHATSGMPAASSALASFSRRTATSVAPLTMPFDVGWLPDGSVSYLARRMNVGATSASAPPVFDGEYLLTVTAPGRVVDIDVQQMPGGLDGVHFKSGPGRPVTIGGRPGVESVNAGGPGGYEVYFIDSAGALMYVNAWPHEGRTSPGAAELAAIGLRVAESVRFPGTAQVAPSFGVGYVPDGTRVSAFDVGHAAGGTHNATTSYEIGTSDSQDSVADVGTNAIVRPGGTPGRQVQGHPTRYSDDHGWVTLYVLRAVNGDTVAISSRLPLSEIYKIADGLRLPS